MPDRQASLVAQAPPLPSKRTRFKRSHSDNLYKPNIQLTPKSQCLSKLRKGRKVPLTLPSKTENNPGDYLLTRSSVTKTIVFATTNIETIPVNKLNNSKLPADNIISLPEETADIDDEPALATFNVDIRNPVDKILEEQHTVSTQNLDLDYIHRSSSNTMVSPSKNTISKPSMCHEQNGVELKASPLVPQKRNYKRRQKEAQQYQRLTRASSSIALKNSFSENGKSSISNNTTSALVSLNSVSSNSTNTPNISISSSPQDETAEKIVMTQKLSSLAPPVGLGELLPCKKCDSGSEEEISPPSSPTCLGFDTKTFYSNIRIDDTEKQSSFNDKTTSSELLNHSDCLSQQEELPLYKTGMKFEKDLVPLSSAQNSCDKLPDTFLENDSEPKPYSDEYLPLMNGQYGMDPTHKKTIAEVVKFSRKFGIRKGAVKFNIPLNTIKRWIKISKEHNFQQKQSTSDKNSIKKTKFNGLDQAHVDPKCSKYDDRIVRKIAKKTLLTKSIKKEDYGDKKVDSLENHQESQPVALENKDCQEIKQQDVEFDEWCNILEICEPCSDDDESITDNMAKIQDQIETVDKEKSSEDGKTNCINSIKEERIRKSSNKSKKKLETNNSCNEDDKSIIHMHNEFNGVIKKNGNINCESELESTKCSQKIKEKLNSSKSLSKIKPTSVFDPKLKESKKEKNVENVGHVEYNVEPRKDTNLTNSRNNIDLPPVLGPDTIGNMGQSMKPKRGRPRKKRATDESISATIESVVKNGLLKYEESLIEAKCEQYKDIGLIEDAKLQQCKQIDIADDSNCEPCKEIDLSDLPLSQVHKLRKELMRSIFLQKKKEQYKEIFKKKKMNGTLKLKARKTKICMSKSLNKWKEYKIKKQKVQGENLVEPDESTVKTSKENIPSKIISNPENKIQSSNSETFENSNINKTSHSRLCRKRGVRKLKPSVVTLEEKSTAKASHENISHNQHSYSFYDSDIARPSRHIVRPVRYLDFLKQDTDMTIMRLHHDGEKRTLPYDLDKLDWNKDHSVNTQGVYCYCGSSGSWYNKMVRCCRCDQWFHERCLAPRPFAMPIISGDPFWLFVCSMCNIGSECLKRMDFSWIDLVHLALYDLSSKTNRKFHHFDNDLMPFMLKNWAFFQLYKHFNCLNDSEKIMKTKETLFNTNKKFEQGAETGQQDGLWALRQYLPPERPIYKVPDIGIISERTVLDEASVTVTFPSNPDLFMNISKHFNIVYKEYVKPIFPEKTKKVKTKKSLGIKKISVKKPSAKNSTQLNSCPSQLISHKNIQKSLKCKVKFKCLKLPDEFKELLTEKYETKVEEIKETKVEKVEKKKPLPYEISKTLHERGYPKVAMKFATIIPPKKEAVVQVLKAEQQKPKKKRGPKSKKPFVNHVHIEDSFDEKESTSEISESRLLDALIPVKLDYHGENNPFNLGSTKEQRAARNLICNRKLKKEDLTKCRSKLRKRKYHLFIEESRKLWKNNESILDKVSTRRQKKIIEEANQDQDLQYAGKYTTPSGEIKFLLCNPEEDEDESQINSI